MMGDRTILIVEDNPADVRLMREALRDFHPPVQIHVASDGDIALSMLRQQGEYANLRRPSLILLDFSLPKADSREVLRYLKDDVALCMIPVAVLTTSDAERDVRDAYCLHANCYLRKPIELDAFLGTIRAAVHFWLDVVFRPF
jgi:CheY-like chemotaxis protein